MSSRLRGRVLLASLAVLVAIAAVAAWRALRHNRPRPAAIVDILAIDGEYGVVVRDVAADPDRSFVSLFHVTGAELWGALVPRYAAAGQPRSAIAATAEVIAVRTSAGGRPSIIAFHAPSGDKLGRVSPLGPRRDDTGGDFAFPTVSSVYGDGRAFEIFGRPGAWATAFGMNLENGALLWLTDLGPDPVERVWLRGDRLLLERPSTITWLDVATGAASPIAKRGRICVIGEAVYAGDGDTLRPVSRDADVNPLPAGRDRAAGQLTGECGTYRDTLVVALSLDGGRSALRALDWPPAPDVSGAPDVPGAPDVGRRESQAVRWNLEFDHAWPARPVAASAPDRAPLAGRLTAFVPVLLGSPAALIMIDVARGQVAWQSPALPAQGDASLFTADGMHYLDRPGDGVLAVFDGTTGALVAAIRTPARPAVRPRQVAGGRIWLYRDDARIVLDSRSLQVIYRDEPSDVIADIHTELARSLGVVPR